MFLPYEIIDFIEKNRISTAEIGDALGKVGGIDGVVPLIKDLHFVGEVFYTFAYADSNWMIHNDAINVSKNSVVFIENLDNTNKALFGEIVSRFIIDKREAKAIVTNGKIRDISELRKLNIPIWHNGISPIGCYNSKPVYTDSLDELAQKRKEELDGAIMVCDDDGAVLIEKNSISSELLNKIKILQEQEKIWKECVFDKGWDTFETICLKRYLG